MTLSDLPVWRLKKAYCIHTCCVIEHNNRFDRDCDSILVIGVLRDLKMLFFVGARFLPYRVYSEKQGIYLDCIVKNV